MYILTIDAMQSLISHYGCANIIQQIQDRLVYDFGHWEDFVCSPRFAHYIAEGVVELMPIGNRDYFSYKYVNGHPNNVANGHPSIMGIGQLSDCHTGMPLLLSEMTILTALRTAATTGLVAKYGAKKTSTTLCMVGNGSQSVFQTIAICSQFGITTIHHYDIDSQAMETYANHIHSLYPEVYCISCIDSHQAAQGADIIITVTEQFGCHKLISGTDVTPGTFIAAVGGDCPNKTEIDPDLVKDSFVIVEYEPQTRIEGEIQHCPEKAIDAHIRELVQGKKTIRHDNNQIILFDSVGFALEDYSALHVMYEILSKQSNPPYCNLIPGEMNNLKDLYGYATTRSI